MNDINPLQDSNRREFLKNTSLATLMTMMGGVELRAEDAAKTAPAGPALTVIPPPPSVNFGVIGLNDRGREILTQLSLMSADAGGCDMRHLTSTHCKAAVGKLPRPSVNTDDYKELLADPNVQAVVIATPTAHRIVEIHAWPPSLPIRTVLVCEAPLANTIDDAKEIAKGARDAVKLVFQPGLQ